VSAGSMQTRTMGGLNPDKIKVQRTSVSGPLVTVLPKFGKGGFVPLPPTRTYHRSQR
jgi:hypothetical protein